MSLKRGLMSNVRGDHMHFLQADIVQCKTVEDVLLLQCLLSATNKYKVDILSFCIPKETNDVGSWSLLADVAMKGTINHLKVATYPGAGGGKLVGNQSGIKKVLSSSGSVEISWLKCENEEELQKLQYLLSSVQVEWNIEQVVMRAATEESWYLLAELSKLFVTNKRIS